MWSQVPGLVFRLTTKMAMCLSIHISKILKDHQFYRVDKITGNEYSLSTALPPGVNFDLSHAGKGPSHGWFFFSCYNSEQANSLLEVNASQSDKDFIMAVNWKKAEEYVKAGKGKKICHMHIMFRMKKHILPYQKVSTKYWF